MPIYNDIARNHGLKVDRLMAGALWARVLNYITSFYLDYRANRKRIRKLPAVFPIVLYNGRRDWTAPTDIRELIEATPPLGEYALQFRYLLLNEQEFSQERLLTIRNIVSTLFLAEGHYDIQLLEAELLALYDREEDKQAVSLFLNWFRQLALYGRVSPEDYGKLDSVYRTKEEVRTMLVTALERERKKMYEKAYREGREEGRLEAQRQTVLQLLTFRFKLDEAKQEQLSQQLAKIEDGRVLTELINGFLRTESTWAELTEQLVRSAPSAQSE